MPMKTRKLSEFLHRLFGISLLPLSLFGPFNFIRVAAARMRGVKIGKGVYLGYMIYIDQPPERDEPGVEIMDYAATEVEPLFSATMQHYSVLAQKKINVYESHYWRGATLGIHVIGRPGFTIGEGALIGMNSFLA